MSHIYTNDGGALSPAEIEIVSHVSSPAESIIGVIPTGLLHCLPGRILIRGVVRAGFGQSVTLCKIKILAEILYQQHSHV